MRIIFIIVNIFLPTIAFSHGGGLDNKGGHTDAKSGYHCHREGCSAERKNSDDALSDALKKERAFSFVYRREDWKHWSDFDGDCMNTRHEILKDQADGPITLSPDGCFVSMGVWDDPFSGKRLTRASDLDVDHIVPLKWANDHGGSRWSVKMKEAFANDPLNLLAVDDGLNQSKGAKGPSEWMPVNQLFRCEYLRMWDSVLHKYPDLVMQAKEKRIFDRQKQACKL